MFLLTCGPSNPATPFCPLDPRSPYDRNIEPRLSATGLTVKTGKERLTVKNLKNELSSQAYPLSRRTTFTIFALLSLSAL